MMSVKLFRAALLLRTAFYILRFTYCVLGTALLSFTHCTTFYVRRYGFYVLRYGAQTQSHNAITLQSGKYLPGKVLFYCH